MKKPRYTDGHRYPHGYTIHEATDVRKTFERVRREMKEKAERSQSVVQLKRSANK